MNEDSPSLLSGHYNCCSYDPNFNVKVINNMVSCYHCFEGECLARDLETKTCIVWTSAFENHPNNLGKDPKQIALQTAESAWKKICKGTEETDFLEELFQYLPQQ